jgi:DNA polymerase V
MELKKQTIRIYKAADLQEYIEFPYVGNIRAGFASPAEDYQAEPIDLNRLLIKNRNYTFIGRVAGASMLKNGRFKDGDLMIIDRSLEPRENDKVVIYLDGEFTSKYVKIDKDGLICLIPDNDDFPVVEYTLTQDSVVVIWGVVTFTIHKHR